MKNLTFYLFLTILGLTIVSCANNSNEQQQVLGTITGSVTSPSGVPIGSALVTVKDALTPIETMTNGNGRFTLMAPIGDQVLEITTGNGDIFRSEVAVTIEAEVETTVEAIRLGQVGQLAYVPGEFDEIEAIIEDALGYQADQLNVADLTTDGIYEYSGLFLNCGWESVTSDISASIGSYIDNGGSVYASDFAVSYLIGNLSGGFTCPDSRDGTGFLPTEKLCTFKNGDVEFKPATIVDPNLATFVGMSDLEVEYDLAQWEKIDSYDSEFWSVEVVSTNDEPLMLKRTKPSAWPSETPFGNIFFTTFHNHPGEMAPDEIVKMLEYVILNL